MKTNQNIYMLLLMLCLGYAASAQQSTSTLLPGYWTFGLNAGLAYQSSDVKAKIEGFGFGATLGKNIYYQPDAPLAFDLRGRFLYTRQYGLNSLRSYNIQNNLALNGAGLLDYTAYPAGLEEPRGFVFQNHETTTTELGLEGLITLNQLRERTGVHLGLFGGLGLDWFKAKTDQAGFDGNEYFEAYANINETRSTSSIRNELERILDGNYETVADGNKDNGSVRFMPSLGVELGLQLSPYFLVYGGHRVTFSGTDALDGERFADPNNDLYHYTNLGLRWTINAAKDKPLARLPEIDLVSPLGSPYTMNTSNGLVIANIRHINSAADVDCIVNGRSVPFDYKNGRFSVTTNLKPGSNELLIIARNEHGQDREKLILVYKEAIIETPRIEAPRVRFTSPANSGFRTDASDYGIRATVDHVQDRRDVIFRVNGIERDFIFENGILRSNIPLREGDNRVQISARNTAGSDEAEVDIIREVRLPLPVVDITEPTGSRVESRYRDARVTAQIRNVESKDQIYLVINGKNSNNFEYDENKGYIFANIRLDNGSNTIVLTARSRAGEARDEVIIVYQESLPEPKYPPAVRITEPVRTSTITTQATARIEAIISNVSDSRDISFVVNGSRRSDFSFDSRNGRLTANISLFLGNNEIIIRAINRDGEAQESTSIRREEIVVSRPPVVRIYAPVNNSETEVAYTDLRANIDHVDSKNQIYLVVNGRNIYDFDFNRGQLNARVALLEGNNTIQVRANNRDGNDEASVSIRYRKVQLPYVQISSPGNNSETGAAAAQIRARVENVENKSQVRLLVNGRNTSFNLDRNLRNITATITLSEGNNTIRVEAQNSAGNASDQITVRYRRAAPPTVRISSPAHNTTTESANANLQAKVTNVSNRNDVILRVNGNLVSNFNLTGSDLSANIVLREGSNTITVRVSNADGSDEASVNVIYQAFQKPVITITDPVRSPFEIGQNNYIVRAILKNVESKNDISIQLNRATYSFFNFDSKSGEVVIRAINLKEGDNSLLIKANNKSGSDEASLTLRFQTPKPPTVAITEPANGSTTQVNKTTVRAIIANINSMRNISFKVNGKAISEFDLKGEEFSGEAELQAGENVITISAKNEFGLAEASTKVIFQLKAVQLLRPNVRFVQPSKSGIVLKERSYNIKASVINVAARGEIQMWINDEETTDFEYNMRTKQLNSVVTLQPGRSTVRIKAQNKGGSHEAETIIMYEAADLPVITIVSISQPTVNPFRPQVGSSTIIARIENVSGKESVKILVNDVEIDDFSYNAASKEIKATVQLKKGKNTLILQASNDGGTTEEKRTVDF